MRRVYGLIFVIITLSFASCGSNKDSVTTKNDAELVKQYFGIDINDYEIIEVSNMLNGNTYGGSCYMELKVNEERIEKFISDIEIAQYFLFDIDNTEKYREGERKAYYNVIEEMSQRNAEDADAIHMYTGSPKRYFNSEWQLLTAHGYAAIFENEGEDYSVYIEYVE